MCVCSEQSSPSSTLSADQRALSVTLTSAAMSVAAGSSGSVSLQSPPSDMHTTAPSDPLATSTSITASSELSTSQLCDRSGSNTFTDLMPTPKIIKKAYRKKTRSLNYTGNVVSKHLFNDEQQGEKKTKRITHKLKGLDKEVSKHRDEKIMYKSSQTKSVKKNKSKNGIDKAQDKNRNNKSDSNKRKGSNLQFGQHAKSAQVVGKRRSSSTEKIGDSWFCIVCRQDKQLSMTKCGQCGQWLDDECIGLDSGVEEETFACPYCDE